MAKEQSPQSESSAERASDGAESKSSAPLPRRVFGWVAANRLRALIVGAAGLLSVTTSVVAWLLLARAAPVDKPTLNPALEALDRGVFDDARSLAEKYRTEVPEDRTGGVDFVLGAIAAYRADASSSELRPQHCLAAARQLEKARDQGFPPGRDAEGLYLLGKSLFFAGQLAASRPALREALKLNPSHDAEIRYLLAEAYLSDAKPNPALAEEENRLALADRELGRWQGKLLIQRARILLAQGNSAETLKSLDALPAAVKRSAEALLVRGQLMALEAKSVRASPELARQKYRQAIEMLRQAEAADAASSDVTRKTMYLVGVCLLESDDQRAATVQFQRTARIYPHTAEAAISAFQEGELLRKAGDREALRLYAKLLAWADGENYVNPWIPLAQLQEKMLAVYQDYLQRQDFQACLDLARAFHPLFPQYRAEELQAETEMAWGRTLAAKADAEPLKAESLRREARGHFRQAGLRYAELARLLIVNRRYPEELWNCAQAFLEGHDYRRAAETLDLYLKNETRRRNAQAMVAMGEALLAQGQLDGALKVLTTCTVLHPRDASAFRARLDAAKVFVEKAQPAKAEALLRENLQAELLTPASPEWRESLFDLAGLMYSEGRYEEAIPRLDEAAERYPQSPRAAEARYLAADACRQRGLQIQQGLSRVLVESTRIEQTRQATDYLTSALERMEQLCQLLTRKPEVELRRPDALLLRNAYFAIGEMLFALGRYEDAAKAYSVVVRHYPEDPDSLEAYVQIAAAYRRLNRAREAQGAAEQAKVMLNRLKSDAALSATNRDRRQWTELFNSLIANNQ
jgi:tetratricopeptide (TPR) repeat protein